MEANSSSSKPEIKITLQVFAQNIEVVISRGHQGIDQGVGPTPQAYSKKRQFQDGTKFLVMEMVLMVIVILVIILATKPWIAEAM